MIKLFSLFSGIGAFEKALKRLKIPYELVGFSEIDKFAIKSYCAIHNVSEDKNYGDITKIDPRELPDFDIMTWGFPCQDISIAGKMKGIKENETRSGLYYEGYRILKEKLPKYSIIENVKNLTSKRFKKQFDSILEDLSELGYTNYWQVLNAKDYCIPQNRERVFIVSIRNDIAQSNFAFPPKQKLKIKLKDILENTVEEKYYLSDKAIGRLIRKNNRLIRNKENPDVSSCLLAGYHKMDGRNNQYIAENTKVERIGGIYDKENEKRQAGSIYDENGLSPTLTTMKGGGNKQPFILISEGTKKGYVEASKGDSINYSYPNNLRKRGRVGKGISQTILTSPTIAVLENAKNNIETIQGNNSGKVTKSSSILISEDKEIYMRIRKLTPLECWRLMRV